MSIVSDVEIRLRADIARLQSDMTAARRTVDNATSGMSKAVEQLKGAFVGLAAAFSLKEIAGQVITAQREFDKLNASLITATGSTQNAAQAFSALQKFAARTPYDLAQTTEAFLKLRNLGLTPSERALNSYGNTAGAMGKSLMQLVEAVADATTGEFERLKEFGIKAKQNGAMVALTFQGVTTNIGNNAAEIEKYLLELGETKFAGGMELQAKTLDGAISALGDSWKGALRAFAQTGFAEQARGGAIALTEALNDMQEALKAASTSVRENGTQAEKLGPLYQALSAVLRQVVIIGTQVSFVFIALARNIAAAFLAINEVGKGEFSNALTILKDRMTAVGQEWEDVNKRIEAIDGAAAAAREKATAEEGQVQQDRLSRYKVVADTISAGEQATLDALQSVIEGEKEAQEARVKASAAVVAARKKEADDALAFYTKTREASIDQLQVLEAERDGRAALTSEEKKRVEILNDLLKFGKNLTAQQRNDIRGWAESIPVLAKYNAELAKAAALRKQREGEAYNDVNAANAQTQSLQDQITYYGLTEEAVLRLKAAEIERGIAGGEIDDIERERLQGLLVATNDQIVLQTKLTKMKAESTFWSGLESTAKQTFLSIANGSKDAATRLKETFKNIFFDWLYQMTLKKWVINIGTAFSGTAGVSGIANAATGGGLGGIASLADIGNKLYSGLTNGFAGVGASIGGLVAGFGNIVNSASISAFGAGMGLTSAQAANAAAAYNAAGMAGTGSALTSGSLAGATAAELAGIAAGVLGGRALSGGYGVSGSGNGVVNVGTAAGAVIGSILPGIGTAIGGLLGGLLGGGINRLFGRKAPKIESQGLSGTITSAGINAQTYANIVEKGGTFRSDKRYTQRAVLDAVTDSGLDTMIAAMSTSVKGFAQTLGLQASAIDSYTKVFDLKLTGDAAKDNELVLGLLDTVGNEMADRLVPGLSRFALEGESASKTLTRLTANYAATDAVMTAIGKTVGVVGIAGIEARERLIAAAGGLDALVSGVSFFQQNFLTQAEQIAPVQKQVAESLAALGLSSIKTNDQFKAAVLGIDVSTEAGAQLFAQMIALAPAFKTVADYADALAGVVRKSEAEVRSERANLQNQLDQLIMSPAQLAEKARNAIDASNRDLYDKIIAAQARLDRAAALDTEATALQAVIDKSKAWITTLKDANNSLALSNQSPLTPLEKYEEARRQLEATLAQARAGDAEAQSALSSIEQAFLAASQAVNAGDAKYAADYAMVINANKEAIAWASKQASIDEQSLSAMQRQIELLNNLNSSANTIAQIMAGDFSSYAAAPANDALVAEVKGLRADNAALQTRIDQLITGQQEQTGAVVQATVDSNVAAAQTVVGGVSDSAQTTARAVMLKAEATYV